MCRWRLGRRGHDAHGVGRDGRRRIGAAAPFPAGPPLTPSPPPAWYVYRRPPAPPPTTRVNEPGRGSVGRTTGGPPCRRLAFRRRTARLQPPLPPLTPGPPAKAVCPRARALTHTCTQAARVTAGSTTRWGGERPRVAHTPAAAPLVRPSASPTGGYEYQRSGPQAGGQVRAGASRWGSPTRGRRRRPCGPRGIGLLACFLFFFFPCPYVYALSAGSQRPPPPLTVCRVSVPRGGHCLGGSGRAAR